MNSKELDIIRIAEDKLSPERFEHSLRVAETAGKLAFGRKVNTEKLYVASLLHDYAKYMPEQELLSIARENGIIVCEAEEEQPYLLHGPVGAWLCREELRITDPEILQAIRYHTTGHPSMTLLDAIVYLADLIEPGRSFDGVERLREACAKDLEYGLLASFDETLIYVIARSFLIHPYTVQARNHLLSRMKSGGEL